MIRRLSLVTSSNEALGCDAILAAILFPVFARAREKARAASAGRPHAAVVGYSVPRLPELENVEELSLQAVERFHPEGEIRGTQMPMIMV